MKIKPYIKVMRPTSWLKNVFVFIPPVFALSLTNMTKMKDTCIAFSAFCLISSSIYILNDLFDVENDKKHPIKCKRPIASGEATTKKSIVLSALLMVIAISLASKQSISVALILAAYVVVNILYFIILKHRPIFDCFCIALGFVLRIYAGSFASGDEVSGWLFLTVISMSLFMAFGKRHGEMTLVTADNRRAVLEWYNFTFLIGMIFLCAGLSIVFYSLWALNRNSNMIYTVPLIIFIVCKYLLIVCDGISHADPITVIMDDRTIRLACVVYSLLTIALLYFG